MRADHDHDIDPDEQAGFWTRLGYRLIDWEPPPWMTEPIDARTTRKIFWTLVAIVILMVIFRKEMY